MPPSPARTTFRLDGPTAMTMKLRSSPRTTIEYIELRHIWFGCRQGKRLSI